MAGDEVPLTEADGQRESSTQQRRNPNIWHFVSLPLMSEIDNIFASKGALVTSPSSSLSSKKKKKKKRPTAMAIALQDSTQPEPSKKRRLPDTIVDTSHELSTLPKRRKKDKSSRPGNPEDIAAFKDSRSDTGRKPFYECRT